MIIATALPTIAADLGGLGLHAGFDGQLADLRQTFRYLRQETRLYTWDDGGSGTVRGLRG